MRKIIDLTLNFIKGIMPGRSVDTPRANIDSSPSSPMREASSADMEQILRERLEDKNSPLGWE